MSAAKAWCLSERRRGGFGSGRMNGQWHSIPPQLCSSSLWPAPGTSSKHSVLKPSNGGGCSGTNSTKLAMKWVVRIMTSFYLTALPGNSTRHTQHICPRSKPALQGSALWQPITAAGNKKASSLSACFQCVIIVSKRHLKTANMTVTSRHIRKYQVKWKF